MVRHFITIYSGQERGTALLRVEFKKRYTNWEMSHKFNDNSIHDKFRGVVCGRGNVVDWNR